MYPSPKTRFGSVPIQTISRVGSPHPDWRPDLKAVTHHFPGGNTSQVEVLGQGRLQLVVTLWLTDPDRLEQLYALLGTEQTLRMRYQATVFPGDRDGQDVDGLYEDFDGVFLSSLSDISQRPDGRIEVKATFERGPS